ncbi:energy-coupling factor transport system ATP-binding protein [Caminicella sporogenes DSM 14501]|uniref:Energy-coupling factor transport system ATP-binding protein n=1 Tax=Caminicella sporogenes DSM 14501 TaxID=1121266 RepID=A0A1M6TCX9_9FIRM|nr:energy-coupling factor transporter ATPase [Caminicella sporogenes]RKD25409.1 energy-coupling factor transporter ATPase [Caminicella sporogenes]SHK54892.1 energy-coupling factor transport system ATP-binding protein [Caminicella sporogenes DSM 14501]
MTNMVETKKLVFEYIKDENKKVCAVNNLSIEIKKGEFVVIIGHNGSGKSTLAKLMNAILLPSGGKVYINNMDTLDEDKLWDIRRTAGMVFQNPDNQIVATTVEEDVAFGPENLGIEPLEIRKRVDNAMKSVGIESYKRKPPHLLSGGQKQRVAIAGVLAMKPECIIFDEPTAMLDPLGRKEVMDTIMKLNKEGITIIHITHFMDEAVNADRVIVMDKGQIVLEGTPREIFSQVEKLKKLGLDVPQVTLLAHSLKKEGINISQDILTVDEMVSKLCQLL